MNKIIKDNSNLSAYTIIIVEDDVSLNILIQRALEKVFVKSIGFHTGNEALEYFENNDDSNKILLLDYQLFDMNGEFLIRTLKNNKKEIPFVIITGHGDEKTAVDMMRLGALDYIIKDSNFLSLMPNVVLQVINNITIEKKLIESQLALKKSEEKYRSIFENILDVYFELTPSGIIKELSPSIKTIFKYSKEDLINKPLFDNKSIEKNFLDIIYNQGIISDFEVTLSTKNNTNIPCSLTAKIIYDIENNPEKIIGTIRNISERKKVEESLRLSEERYRILADNSSDLISKHSWDRTFLYVSPVCKKLLGYDAKEMTGLSVYKFIHSDDIEDIRRNHIYLLENKTTSLIESYRIRKKNGQYIWFETTNQVIYNPLTNLVEEIVCVSRDVTERIEKEELIRAKEVAERSNVAKSEFLANMSHEIRNPMNAIIGMANTLSKTELEENQKKYLNSILLSDRTLLNILNDILDFSKIEANKVDITYSEFELNKLMSKVTKLYEPICSQKNLAFETKIEKDIVNKLYGDEQKIVQILNNLLSNSVKFTNSGKISIEVTQTYIKDSNVKLKFTVKDTGVGVRKKDISKLFESFRQLDISTKKEYQGTGLGLSIVKRLAELMNGNVVFESVYGKGSTVSFEVPLIISETNPIHQELDAASSKKQFKSNKLIKILVAEDDAINQLYIASFLKSKGWQVSTASNGIKAIEEFQKESFDIILMDGQMPKMDGFEATKNIREIENQSGKNKNIPIIAITGYAIQGDRERFIDAGMDDYITKPIDENKLVQIIEKYTEKK
ncbi:MAG: response regulator [Bacteroidetes bacterium]|nr:response regulator [Bacteroidota bacterium]